MTEGMWNAATVATLLFVFAIVAGWCATGQSMKGR